MNLASLINTSIGTRNFQNMVAVPSTKPLNPNSKLDEYTVYIEWQDGVAEIRVFQDENATKNSNFPSISNEFAYKGLAPGPNSKVETLYGKFSDEALRVIRFLVGATQRLHMFSLAPVDYFELNYPGFKEGFLEASKRSGPMDILFVGKSQKGYKTYYRMFPLAAFSSGVDCVFYSVERDRTILSFVADSKLQFFKINLNIPVKI